MNSILTPFPELLNYSIFAPLLLRIAAAIILAYLAYYHYQHRNNAAARRFPIVGDGIWIAWLAIAVEAATASALFFGYYTQYAAIFGAAVALKNIVWGSKYSHFFILPKSTAFLLLVITLSLLMTGAGIFAFDLPL